MSNSAISASSSAPIDDITSLMKHGAKLDNDEEQRMREAIAIYLKNLKEKQKKVMSKPRLDRVKVKPIRKKLCFDC